MKEAAGEANMTVITIMLIGIVLAAGTLIINGVLTSVKKNACEADNGTWANGKCSNGLDYSQQTGTNE